MPSAEEKGECICMWLSQQNTNAASGQLYHTQPSHWSHLTSLVLQPVKLDKEVEDKKQDKWLILEKYCKWFSPQWNMNIIPKTAWV